MEIANVLWAVGALMMRRARFTLQVETLTLWMLALTSASLWSLAFVTETWPQWQLSPPMWWSLVYSAFINY